MTGFDLVHIQEPSLTFAERGEKKGPRAGLLEYGPCRPGDSVEHEIVNVGIIGDSRSISMMKGLLKDMRTGVESKDDTRQQWRPPFPGLGVGSELRFDYQSHSKWEGRILSDDIKTIANIPDRDNRIQPALRYINYQIKNVCKQTPPPDIVFVSIPERIVELCSDSDTDTAEIRTSEGSNFRSKIKLFGMQNRTPTQVVSPRTLRGGTGVQDRSEIAWNLAVGMLYKAREGRPWKLAKLRNRTCYAGISFYQQRNEEETVRAALAQVFIDDGRHFVIEGGPVEDVASEKRRTHLAYQDAKQLVEEILEKYGTQRDHRPERLVLHKSSNFLAEETEGFADGAAGVSETEFITIRKHHPLRLFSGGDYPVLRGTLAIPPDESEYYLYTTGFVPEIGVYPNPATPNPLVLRPHDRHFTGDYRRMCEEILSFTKLDWNSSDFCRRLPVTISIADAVSEILAEPEVSNTDLETHYYYYM